MFMRKQELFYAYISHNIFVSKFFELYLKYFLKYMCKLFWNYMYG